MDIGSSPLVGTNPGSSLSMTSGGIVTTSGELPMSTSSAPYSVSGTWQDNSSHTGSWDFSLTVSPSVSSSVTVSSGGIASSPDSLAPGTYSVAGTDCTSTTAGGTCSSSGSNGYWGFMLSASPSTVTAVSPSSGPVGGGTTVTITGTGFSTGATVNFGANAATGFTFNSPTSITATSPAGTAGPVDVTVTVDGSTSVTSSVDQFTYLAAPTVTAISPSTGPAAGGTVVTITGTGFVSGARVNFGANAATEVTFNNSTSITATSPAGSGTVAVTVATSGGTSATSSAPDFVYGVSPTVTGISPSSGRAVGGTVVTISGIGFVSGATVNFGANAATGVIFDSSTSMTATSPAGSGTVAVTVTTSGGTSPTSSLADFTYNAVPTVTAISPENGPAAGGTTVTITGTGFVSGATVDFGANRGTSATVSSSGDSITVGSPAGVAGTVYVTVTTPGGTSTASSVAEFNYTVVPVVSALSPSSGPASGGTTVTITGTGFVTGLSVDFGNDSAKGVSLIGSTSVTATSPEGSVGTVAVTVVTVGGTSATSPAADFTYTPAPPPLWKSGCPSAPRFR